MSRFNVDNYAKFKIDVVYYQDVKDKSKIYAVEIDMATPQDIQVLTDKNQPTLKLDTDDYRESSAKQRYERQTKYKVKKADGKLLRDKNNKVITYSNKATAQKKSKELKGKVEPIKIKATKYKKSELLRDESGRFLSRGETESLKSISEKTKKPLKDIVGKKLIGRVVLPADETYDITYYYDDSWSPITHNSSGVLVPTEIPEVKSVLNVTQSASVSGSIDATQPTTFYNAYSDNDVVDTNMSQYGKPYSASVDNKDIEYGVQTWTPTYDN